MKRSARRTDGLLALLALLVVIAAVVGVGLVVHAWLFAPEPCEKAYGKGWIVHYNVAGPKTCQNYLVDDSGDLPYP